MNISLSIIVILGVNISLFSQNPEIIKSSIHYQWTVFVTPDSNFHCTKFIKPNGKFYFRRNFEDTAYYKAQVNVYGLLKKEKKKNITVNEYVSFFFINKIDTLYSFNKTIVEYPDSSKWIPIPSGGIGLEDLLLEDIERSYILQALNQKNSDSIVYLLYNEDWLSFSDDRYILLKLDYLLKDEYNFCKYTFQSKNYTGIQVIGKDSVIVSEKKLNAFAKKMNALKNINNKNCLVPSQPWLLAFGDKRFLISDYCMREFGKRDKSLKQIKGIFDSLISLKYTYFRN